MAQFNVDYFNKIDTEQKAYILGFLQGDGSFSGKGRIKGYYRYKLSIQERDEEILIKMMSCLSHTGLLFTEESKNPKHQSLKELSLNGIVFTDHLKSVFGGYLKDDRLNFPLLPSNLLRHYIRGVVDADGSMGQYPDTSIRIYGKEHFLESIRDITGFRLFLTKTKGKTTYRLGGYGEEAVNIIEWLYTDLSEESLFLERKMNSANVILTSHNVVFKGVA